MPRYSFSRLNQGKKMKIKRDGIVFKTAYLFTDPSKVPTSNTLNGCTLFWRFIFFGILILLLYPLFWGLYFVASAIFIVINLTIGSLFGFKFVRPDKDKLTWSPIRRENYLYFNGRRILPGIVIVIIMLLLFQGLLILGSIKDLQSESDGTIFESYPALILVITEGIVFSLAFIIIWFSGFRKSEFGKLAGSYIKSFKDKTCPVITVVD